MSCIRVGSLNVRGLMSGWKQGRFLNDTRSSDLETIVVTESGIRGPAVGRLQEVFFLLQDVIQAVVECWFY